MPLRKEIWLVISRDTNTPNFRTALEARYQVRGFSNLGDLGNALTQSKPALAVVDLRYEDQTLLSFLSRPESGGMPPFIVLSDVDDGDVLRACFERGAVDFIRKPFSLGEMLARTERAVTQNLGSLTAAATSMRATLGGKRSDLLTAKEFQILNLFLAAPWRRLSRQAIISGIWSDVQVVPKTFDVHLSKLRRSWNRSECGLRTRPRGTTSWSWKITSGSFWELVRRRSPSRWVFSFRSPTRIVSGSFPLPEYLSTPEVRSI